MKQELPQTNARDKGGDPCQVKGHTSPMILSMSHSIESVYLEAPLMVVIIFMCLDFEPKSNKHFQ